MWGNLGPRPHKFLAVGAIASMESAPMAMLYALHLGYLLRLYSVHSDMCYISTSSIIKLCFTESQKLLLLLSVVPVCYCVCAWFITPVGYNCLCGK